jgi:predicted transport protein
MLPMMELMDLLPLYYLLQNKKYRCYNNCRMNKFGLYSEGPKISVEDHLSRLEEPARTIFQEIRNFALSLGSNVIEEVRPHRIVYAKSFNFRTFLDIEPTANGLAVSVKTGPKGQSTKIMISSNEQMENLKELLKQAYTGI